LDINPFYGSRSHCASVNKNRFSNVDLVIGDIYDITHQTQFIRPEPHEIVFSQMGCDKELLEKMINMTEPGGVVISQESTGQAGIVPPSLHGSRSKIAQRPIRNSWEGNQRGVKDLPNVQRSEPDRYSIRTATLAMPVGHATERDYYGLP